MDEGGFILDYIMPAGSSLEETNRVITAVERILRSTPEVETTSRRTGLQLGLAQVTEANIGDISIKLKRDRERSSEEVIADVRAKVAKQEPMLQVEFIQLLQDMIGDLTSAPEPVAIKLFSQDPALLRTWAPQVADAIKKIPGVVDILNGIDNTISGPATVFQVDPATAARAGFTPQEIELDASAIMQGEPATTPVVVNDRAYTIRVRCILNGQERHAGISGDHNRIAGPDGNPARKSTARCHGDGAAGRAEPRRRNAEGAEGGCRLARAAVNPNPVWRRL
jgi:multidrug efflux pump subunit AcrB